MRTIVIGALFASIAASASAQEIMAFGETSVAQKTRAEVMAEVSSAQAQGAMNQQGEITWSPSAVDTSDRSRAVVRREGQSAASAHGLGTVYSPRYEN